MLIFFSGVQFSGKEFKVIRSAGRKTNSIAERLMRFVLETVNRNSDTIKSNEFRLWIRLFFVCMQKIDILAADTHIDIALDNDALLAAMDVPKGPDENLRVSRALFSTWIQEEMCKPVLEMVQELCVDQCNYVVFSGGLSSCGEFRDAITSISTQFVSFKFFSVLLSPLPPLFSFFLCCRMQKYLNGILKTWLLGQLCWPRTSKAGLHSKA